MHIMPSKKLFYKIQRPDQISSGTIVVTDRPRHWTVAMSDVPVQFVLLSVPLDGDHRVAGKLSAKRITPGRIQDSHHASRVLIWVTKSTNTLSSMKMAQLVKRFTDKFSRKTYPLLNFSAEDRQAHSELKTTCLKMVDRNAMWNVFVKMVKMVIQHGRSHVPGHSREHHGTQVMLNLLRAKEGFENSWSRQGRSCLHNWGLDILT